MGLSEPSVGDLPSSRGSVRKVSTCNLQSNTLLYVRQYVGLISEQLVIFPVQSQIP